MSLTTSTTIFEFYLFCPIYLSKLMHKSTRKKLPNTFTSYTHTNHTFGIF